MNKTAILIFSRFAQEEARAKKYDTYLGNKGGVAVAKHLINYTVSEAGRTKLPIITLCSDVQKGTTFGEKLANGIEAAFDKGFENVIVVGTDSPSVSCSLLNSVAEELQNEKIVLGPAKDGGVYIIGIKNSAYNRDAFVDLPWRTASLYSSFMQYANDVGTCIKVDALGEDFDDIGSLLHRKIKNADNFLSTLLDIIISSLHKIKSRFSQHFILNECRLRNISFRAPPL